MKKLLTILFAVALGLNLSAQTVCSNPQDANQDGVIGVDDLMDLLSHWGDTDFDFDGVYDSVDLCTDEGACNYLSNPTEACLYLDAIGACGGGCAEDTDGDGVCDEFSGPCQGQSTMTYQGYTYDLVAIGDQCWFAENLRTIETKSGMPLANSTYYDYGQDEFFDDYGILYRWSIIDSICPISWSAPSDEDFGNLESFLGESPGNDLKNSSTDEIPWDGLNVVGFSAIPAGYRNGSDPNGPLQGFGQQARFWSRSSPSNGAYAVFLISNLDHISWGHMNTSHQYSVRCLKDTEE